MDYKPIGMLAKYAKDYCHAKIRRAGINDTEHKVCAFLYFHAITLALGLILLGSILKKCMREAE